MSKLMTLLTNYSRIGTRARRTIDNSPEFSGVQTSENGRPERQAPAGGFLTG